MRSFGGQEARLLVRWYLARHMFEKANHWRKGHLGHHYLRRRSLLSRGERLRTLAIAVLALLLFTAPAGAVKVYLWLGPSDGPPALAKQFVLAPTQRRSFSFRFDDAAWRAEVRVERPPPNEAGPPGAIDFAVRVYRGSAREPVAVYSYYGRDGGDDCGTSPSVRAGRLWIVLGVGFSAPPDDRCAGILDYVRRSGAR